MPIHGGSSSTFAPWSWRFDDILGAQQLLRREEEAVVMLEHNFGVADDDYPEMEHQAVFVRKMCVLHYPNVGYAYARANDLAG